LLTVVVLALPVVFGLAIGRWWAIPFAIAPAGLLAITATLGGVDRELLDRSLWFLLLVVLHAGLMSVGVAIRGVVRRASAARP